MAQSRDDHSGIEDEIDPFSKRKTPPANPASTAEADSERNDEVEKRRGNKQIDDDRHAYNDERDDYDELYDPLKKQGLGRQYALSRCSAPGICLFYYGILCSIISSISMVLGIINVLDIVNEPLQKRVDQFDMALFLTLVGTFIFGMSLIVVIGASKMMKLESYGWAVASAIVASWGILSCNLLGILGLIFGSQALCVLIDSDVKSEFGRKAKSTT
jgi:hypothetical protein